MKRSKILKVLPKLPYDSSAREQETVAACLLCESYIVHSGRANWNVALISATTTSLTLFCGSPLTYRLSSAVYFKRSCPPSCEKCVFFTSTSRSC